MPSYVVTGSSRGIGLEFVRQLSSDRNNTVIGIVRNKAGAQELARLQAERANVHVFQADVTDFSAMKIAAEEVAKLTDGTLEFLINNAALVQQERGDYTIDAYAEKGELDELKKDMLDNFNVNVLGVIHSIDAFLPLLKAASVKSTVKVITLSSGVGDLDFTTGTRFSTGSAYSISKAALNMAVAKYATRFANDNFVFLSISPGLVNTATRAPTPEELQGFAAMSASFKRVYPEWNGQPLTPEQSVQHQLAVIDNAKIEDSGSFISHLGNKQWL